MCNFQSCQGNLWRMLAKSNKRRGKCERIDTCPFTQTHTHRRVPPGWVIAVQRFEKRLDEILRAVDEAKAGEMKPDLKQDDGSWDQVGTRVWILTSVMGELLCFHLIPYLILVHHRQRSEIIKPLDLHFPPWALHRWEKSSVGGWRETQSDRPSTGPFLMPDFICQCSICSSSEFGFHSNS